MNLTCAHDTMMVWGTLVFSLILLTMFLHVFRGHIRSFRVRIHTSFLENTRPYPVSTINILVDPRQFAIFDDGITYMTPE